MLLQSTEYRHFRVAVLFSSLLAGLSAAVVALVGKEEAFLAVNRHYTPGMDLFFRYLTFLGDGLIWIPLVVWCLWRNRPFFTAVLAALLICTLITHLLKRVVFPDELRPVGALAGRIRTIPGLVLHRVHSFPSGHTSTAFTLALLLAFLLPGRRWAFFFPLVALLVGFSRIYLAQHFPTDVAAGAAIGIVSAFLGLLIYEARRRRKTLAEVVEEN